MPPPRACLELVRAATDGVSEIPAPLPATLERAPPPRSALPVGENDGSGRCGQNRTPTPGPLRVEWRLIAPGPGSASSWRFLRRFHST